MRKVWAVALFVCLLPGLGLAHEQTDLDADDSPGPLDTVAARLWDRVFCNASLHPPRENCFKEIHLKLVTYERWDAQTLSEPKSFISFEFDFDRDDANDRCLVIRTPAEPAEPGDPAIGKPEGRLFRNCTYSDDDHIREIRRIRRRDDYSVRALLRKDKLLPPGAGSFRWRSLTSYERQGDQDCAPAEFSDGGLGACLDYTAWRRHR